MDWDRYNELVELREAGQIEEASAELTTPADAARYPVVRAVIVMAVARGFSWQKRFSDARLTLNQAATMVGSNHVPYPRLLLAIAVVDIEEENWKTALKKLDKIIRQRAAALNTEDNRDVFEETQRNRGAALFALRRVREALPLLQSVRNIEYQKERAIYSIAIRNLELEAYDAALIDFQEVLSLTPNSTYRSHAHYHRGRIYYDQRQLARAKDEFESCLACPERGNLPNQHLLQALVYTCRVLNLESDASRYSQMLESSHLGR